MPFRLTVPRDLVDGMLAHAAEDRWRECCGLLAGRDVGGVNRAERLYRLVNALDSAVEFRSEDRSMLAAALDMRAAGLDVVAVYHSHPTSQPVPSARDREMNYSEDVVNFIVGLTSDPPELRGWWLTAADHREAEWEVS
ncbi:MAG: M67 family metallopeptidase [Gemmataceae bacterium]